MLTVLGLLATDKLHLLKFISTDLIATIILLAGLLLFLFKFWQWRANKTEKKM